MAVKHEIIFQNNILIVRDPSIGQDVLHQPLRPTWGDPVPWQNEQEARDWALTHMSHLFLDPPETDNNNVDSTPGV